MSLLQFLLIQINLVLLFALYKWLAAKKGQFQFNRWFLILGPSVAIVLPFFVFNEAPIVTLEILLPAAEIVHSAEASNLSVIDWTELGLLIGALSVFIVFLNSLWQLIRIKRATYLEEFKGKNVYLLDETAGTTHSFFNKIYLHPSHENYREIILEHEYAHCKYGHSWDLMLMASFKALFWYSPVIYKWGKEMQLNHEYMADAHVLSLGVSPKTYGATLLALNFEQSGGSLIHAFNKPSSLRKRIIHLKHQNTYNMKHLLLIPVLAAIAIGTTSMVSLNLAEVIPVEKKIKTPLNQENEDETQPEYPGGQKGLMNYLKTNLQYPKQMEKEGAEGKVFVQFTIDKTGTVKNPQVVRSSGFEALDEEAVRVISSMQSWKPGTKGGDKVDAKMTLPIVFKLTK